jgi:ribosomal protein S11
MVSQGFYVHPASQTITFPTISGAWYALQQITLSATASSGLAVSFATTTPTVCSVSGNTASLLIAGSCILQATQTGSTVYAAALPVTQVVAAHLAHQSITFTPVTATQYALSQLTLSATSSSGLTVALASATPTVCALSGNTASFLTAGTCDIHANQAGNATYAVAPLIAYGIDVHPIIQTINFATVPAPVYPLTKVTLSATATSGLNVSFASITPTVCTVLGKTASLLIAGNCYIHALQNGNPDYAAAPIVTQQVVVTPLSQTISWPAITGTQYAASQLTLTATASSGLTVAFNSTTPSVCTVAGATASLLTSGTCILKATQAGNAIYAAAPVVQQSVVVHLAPQTITFTAIGGQTVGANVALSATASSGLTVAFSSATPTVCSVAGTTATMLTTGTCAIHATQAGNNVYSVAPTLSQYFTVTAH